jgi:hypothetical protein
LHKLLHCFTQTFSFQCTGCPLHYFSKSYVLHILPSNWQLATSMLLQVDIEKIFSMFQYYISGDKFSFMNVPQSYSYSGLRILQQFSIANFICKILPRTEYNFVFEIYLFSQLLLLRTMKEPFIHFIYFMSNILQIILAHAINLICM